jgi:endonuclease/exonuclease/phosphatase family metal-dependent hydrolase
VFVASAACVPPRPTLAPSGPVPLAVITWNMNAGRGDLPRLLDDLSSGRLTRAPVREYVVLLQEAAEGGEADVAAVARRRGLTVFFGAVRRGPRASGNAILASTALDETRVIELPRERQPRAAVSARVEVAGERLFVASAHLENRLGWLRGLFGDGARRRQATALLAALPPAAPGILGGDMNTMLGPDEPAWRAFLERFDDTPADRPEPTFRERLVLDHLFFDLPDGWTAMRRVVEDRYGSDHHPVLGVVTRE